MFSRNFADWNNEQESVIDRFEKAWQEGSPPDFAAISGELGGPSGLLWELAHIDLEYRLKKGQKARVEDYLPHLEENPPADRTRELAQTEWRFRSLNGTPPPLVEYSRRFPGIDFDLNHAQESSESSPASFGILAERYKLLELIGQGSLGLVYRAQDLAMERTVAVKIARIDPTSPAAATRRFLSEVRLASGLRHPNIVPLFDAGRVGDRCFLVSQFIDGPTLAEKIAAAPCPIADIARWGAALAGALAHSHSQGIVHRDIKPSNIIFDSCDTPFLLDFGIAKRIGEGDSSTVEGQILGTPAYMSPEQAKGLGHRVDGRTDQYSLAATLYHALVGRIPFEGSKEILLQRIVEEEPIRPRIHRPAIPLDLETVLLKALAKDPAHRYADCSAFAADLVAFSKGLPVTARPVGALFRGWRLARRRPMTAGLLAIALTASLGAFATVVAFWHHADAARTIALGHLETVQRQQVELKQTLEDRDRLHRQRDEARAKKAEDNTRMVRSFHQANQTFEIAFNNQRYEHKLDSDQKAMLANALDYYQAFANNEGSVGNDYELALAHLGMARISKRLGKPQKIHGDHCQKAMEALERALEIEPGGAPPSPGSHVSLAALQGEIFREMGDVSQAIQSLEKAKTTVDALASKFPPFQRDVLLANAHFSMATIQRKEKAYPIGILNFQRARKHLDRILVEAPNEPAYWDMAAESCYYEADARHQTGADGSLILELCQEARRFWEKSTTLWIDGRTRQLQLGKTHYLEARIRSDRGQLKDGLNSYMMAAACFEKGVAEFPKALHGQRDLAACHHNIGNILVDLDRSGEAVPHYQKAIRLRASLVDFEPNQLGHRGDLGGSWYRLGLAQEKLGQKEVAKTSLRKAVELQQGVVENKGSPTREKSILQERIAELKRLEG